VCGQGRDQPASLLDATARTARDAAGGLSHLRSLPEALSVLAALTRLAVVDAPTAAAPRYCCVLSSRPSNPSCSTAPTTPLTCSPSRRR
jgi:hypothetical protein